jgi:thiamine pyrophosphokinase
MPAEGDYHDRATRHRVAFLVLDLRSLKWSSMRAIIFANGDPPDRATVQAWLDPAALIIAADGGARNALSIDVTPQVIIGDLDSFDTRDRDWLEQTGAQFIVYPARKDYTDLELAIRHALEQAATEILLFSALGGRWDQSLANLMLLTLPELDHVPTRVLDHRQAIFAIRDRAEISGQPGDTLSLIALAGDVQGITIEGCEYPLNAAVLPLGATLGISNVLREPIARVSVKTGIVLAIHTQRDA